jgi:hypothetical protein
MHLQSQGDEHSGSGNGGASSLKKRLSRIPSVAGHAPDWPTTLTACHGCLKGPGCFVFVAICGRSYAIRCYDHDIGILDAGKAFEAEPWQMTAIGRPWRRR